MFGVDKYYPLQGSNKFQTVSFPITKAFKINLVGTTVGTQTAYTVPVGSLVLGFTGRVAEAMESTGATVQIGFTGLMISSAHDSATATLGTIIAPHFPTSGTAVSFEAFVATADDTFDLIVAAGDINSTSAGKIDVFLTYVPIPVDPLTTADFLSYDYSS
jgi:hypothetical protein